MILEFKIPYPASDKERRRWARDYGLNAYYAGKHWSQRREDAEFWHLLTVGAINRSGIQRTELQKPFRIEFYWGDRLDIDNHAVMGKMITDALKGVLIKDDNFKWFRGVSHDYHEADYILVQIREV